MKNTNFKTKFVARIMFLVLLLASALSFAGCAGYPNKKYILTTHIDNYILESQIRLRATSDTKVFSKNDITFDLSYAMHSRNIWGKSSLQTSNDLYSTYIEKYDVVYGVYILANGYDAWDRRYDAPLSVENIEDVNNYYFIKKLSENEALSEDYVRIYPNFAVGNGADRYNHTESITIPQEVVANTNGMFVVCIIAFVWDEDNSIYNSFELSKIEFSYETIDENIIEIGMEDRKLYFIIP